MSGLLSHVDDKTSTVSAEEIHESMRSIRRRLIEHQDSLEGLILPEGGFFCNVFYGYTVLNLAQTEVTKPKLDPLVELERVVKEAESYQNQHPFNYGLALPGGIIFSGNINRLLAGYALLGGTNPQLLDKFHRYSQLLHAEFERSNPPFPESFPHLSWPVDTICALDSLRLHDQLFQTQYFAVSERWMNWLKAHLDPESHLMIAQVDPKSGAVLDTARGCALSWSLALMPGVFDKQFVASQYKKFRQDWFLPFGPDLLGIREWYRGIRRPTSYLPGPVVGGLGAAATGLGIAATRANGDYQSWHHLLRSLEALGFPLCTKYGEKTYFFGQSLLADVLALWGKTIVPLSAPAVAALPNEGASSNLYIAGIVLYAVLWLASLGALLFLIRAMCVSFRLVRPPLAFMVLGGGLQIVLTGVWLFSPYAGTLQVFLIMLVLVLLETISVRMKLLIEQHRQPDQQPQAPGG